MKPISTTIYFFFIIYVTYGQTGDYRVYHRFINHAEECFFAHKKIDSAFYYYDLAFSSFNYIFAKDAINAVQLALHNKKPFMGYLLKGYENGLKPDYFKNIKLTQDLYTQLVTDTSMIRAYQTQRAKYLKKVNFQYLQTVYELSMEDQIKKNSIDLEYSEFQKMCVNAIKIGIKKYGGFPGSKLLGLADSTVFKEVGFPDFDWNKRKQKYGNRLDYFKIDDDLASDFILVVLLHNSCAFLELEKELRMAVSRGEIHPREVGLLYDNIYRKVNSKYNKCTIPETQNGLFVLNTYTDYRNIPVSDQAVNALRATWDIVPLRIDGLKEEFEDQYGAKLFWGFWKCM